MSSLDNGYQWFDGQGWVDCHDDQKYAEAVEKFRLRIEKSLDEKSGPPSIKEVIDFILVLTEQKVDSGIRKLL